MTQSEWQTLKKAPTWNEVSKRERKKSISETLSLNEIKHHRAIESSKNVAKVKREREYERSRVWGGQMLGGSDSSTPKTTAYTDTEQKIEELSLSLSLQYVISDSYGMAELNSTVSAVAADFNAFPTENFTARFFHRSAKRQKCLHSSTPEMYTNRHSVYTLCNPYMNPNVRIHIVLFYTHTWEPPPYDKLWRYIGFVRLCVCIQEESKRVSYFDCRNHMQIHRKNLFFFPLKMIIATAFLQLKMKFKHLLKLL